MKQKLKDVAVAYKTRAHRYTYEDYLALPDDGRRYEIIEGELHMSPAPTTKHQLVSRILVEKLAMFASGTDSGEILYAPVDVLFDNRNVVQPDILFVAKEHLSRITEENIQGAPDLIIEILSPATAHIDRGVKKALYERSGVREYWLVDPDCESVEIYVLQGGRYMLAQRAENRGRVSSSLLEGFAVELETIFASPFRGRR